jgi:putative membrane protein
MMAYSMITLFALILTLGATYTYARVPLGLTLQEWFELSRNPYDRIGHFFQGATPAIVARELLLRTSPLRPGKWLFALVALSCLGISAGYELIEWQAAVLWADGAVEFLGTQGDVWDPQWDMFLALCGAIAAQLSLAHMHDRQLTRLAANQLAGGTPRT